jgi:hypothetical protein
MIDKTKLIETVLQRVAHLATGHYLDIRTYKRNRYVVIVKSAGEEFTVIVDGYRRERIQVNSGKLEKALSTIFRREFPRSNKIRLYSMGEFTEDTFGSLKRKII